jgi:hypothetical protein
MIQYLEKTNKFLDESKNIQLEEKLKLKQNISNYMKEKEKINNLNFKNFINSLERSINYDDNSRKFIVFISIT